jgi:hypothetical protein
VSFASRLASGNSIVTNAVSVALVDVSTSFIVTNVAAVIKLVYRWAPRLELVLWPNHSRVIHVDL